MVSTIQPDHMRVAILSTMGFEKVEPTGMRDAWIDAGGIVQIVVPEGAAIGVLEFPDWPAELLVDETLETRTIAHKSIPR